MTIFSVVCKLLLKKTMNKNISENIKNLFPVIEGRKIKAAVVGCGRISKNHFESIIEHQDYLELVSICEIKLDILSEHKKKYNVKGYTNLVEMLKNESLDLVILCTPSGIHAEQAEICAKNFVNVVTEKPMATKWSDGLKMVKAC